MYTFLYMTIIYIHINIFLYLFDHFIILKPLNNNSEPWIYICIMFLLLYISYTSNLSKYSLYYLFNILF